MISIHRKESLTYWKLDSHTEVQDDNWNQSSKIENLATHSTSLEFLDLYGSFINKPRENIYMSILVKKKCFESESHLIPINPGLKVPKAQNPLGCSRRRKSWVIQWIGWVGRREIFPFCWVGHGWVTLKSFFRWVTKKMIHMGVSKNRGIPKSSNFNRVFHYFPHPFWGCSPYFWKHPSVSQWFSGEKRTSLTYQNQRLKVDEKSWMDPWIYASAHQAPGREMMKLPLSIGHGSRNPTQKQ